MQRLAAPDEKDVEPYRIQMATYVLVAPGAKDRRRHKMNDGMFIANRTFGLAGEYSRSNSIT